MNYNITRIILELHNHLIEKTEELKNDEHKSEIGLNIHNYVNDEKYRNDCVKSKMNLFINYLLIFNNYHEKYMSRFNLKVKLLYGQIQSDIKLEEEYLNNNIILNLDEEKKMRELIHEESEELDQILYAISDTTISDKTNENSPKTVSTNTIIDDNSLSGSSDSDS